MDSFLTLTLAGIGAIAVLIALSLLFAVPVWLLWNAIVPAVFGLPQISFLQALGLNILCSFLFKSHSSSSKS